MTAHRKPVDEAATTFVRRHIGPSLRDMSAMLETVGAASLAALMAETLPSSIRQQAPLDLGTPLSETEALAHMRESPDYYARLEQMEEQAKLDLGAT